MLSPKRADGKWSIKRISGLVSGVTTIVGGFVGVWMGVINPVIHKLEQVDSNTAAIEALEERVTSLEEQVNEDHGEHSEQLSSVVDATRTELSRLALADSELRGSVNAVQTEVRVRHGADRIAGGVRAASQQSDQARARAGRVLRSTDDDPLAGLDL